MSTSTTGEPYGTPSTRARILDAAWRVVVDKGASMTLADVARAAEVSRQAVYLHFGDRSGLVIGLVQHIDASLRLDESLGIVVAADDGIDLLRRTMRLNTEFWRAVDPVARILEAAQYVDDALGAAWRERMTFRHGTMRVLVERLVALDALDAAWTVDEATDVLYGATHYDTWRELVSFLDWSDDRYVELMTRHVARSLLRPKRD